MMPVSWRSLSAALAFGLALAALGAPRVPGAAEAPLMPEFRHGESAAWLNSQPLRSADLRGKVVLIDLFTTA
jgi:hypothetical protein